MNKRYQVFISSTYTDLKDERQLIFQTLMDIDCIPVGMEFFPAIDEEQFNYIKKIIDDSDYYLLIIAGRYGSLAEDGISYTEKEFDYAVSKNIPVIGLIHGSPETLSLHNSETEKDLRVKLENFKQKVSTNRLVKYWDKKEQLPGLVAINLPKTTKLFPATGWVRGDSVSSSQQVDEINSLLKDNNTLKIEIDELKAQLTTKNGDIIHSVYEKNLDNIYSIKVYDLTGSNVIGVITPTWKELFKEVTINCIDMIVYEKNVRVILEKMFERLLKQNSLGGEISLKETMLTIRNQLRGYKLITVDSFAQDVYWTLTEYGSDLMMKLHMI